MILAGHDYNEKQDDFDHDCLQYQLFSNLIHGHGGLIDVVYKSRYKYNLISYKTANLKKWHILLQRQFILNTIIIKDYSLKDKKDSNVLFMLYLMMTL